MKKNCVYRGYLTHSSKSGFKKVEKKNFFGYVLCAMLGHNTENLRAQEIANCKEKTLNRV